MSSSRSPTSDAESTQVRPFRHQVTTRRPRSLRACRVTPLRLVVRRVARRGDPVAGDDRVRDALAVVLVEHGPGLAIAEPVRADPRLPPAEFLRPVREGHALDVGGEQLGIRGIDRDRRGGGPLREAGRLHDRGLSDPLGRTRTAARTAAATAPASAPPRARRRRRARRAGVATSAAIRRPQGRRRLQIESPERGDPGALALEGRAQRRGRRRAWPRAPLAGGPRASRPRARPARAGSAHRARVCDRSRSMLLHRQDARATDLFPRPAE